MMSNKVKHDINQRIVDYIPTITQKAMDQEVSTLIIPNNSSTRELRYSGRIIIQLNRFMYLKEFFEVIPKNHETNPIYYDEIKKIALYQVSYIDKFLVKYMMQDSKKSFPSFKYGKPLSQDWCPKTSKEKNSIKATPYIPLQLVTLCRHCYVLSQIVALLQG